MTAKTNTPALRSEIEKALDEIVSNEEGMSFQGLAVVLARQRWPELIAANARTILDLTPIRAFPFLQTGSARALP
ncbi:MAG: hypothetical protein ACRD2N_17740, partial [Vicinamibacterales bacterium]